MKGRTIALDHLEGREAAALIVDGRLEDLLIDTDAPRPGTIYRAVPGRILKGQGGAFLDTPDGPAFLRQIKGVTPGKPLLVQVSSYSEPGKAIPVTPRVMIKSRFAIATPEAPGLNLSRSIRDDEERVRILDGVADYKLGDIGAILRSACAGADLDAVLDDLDHALRVAQMVTADTGRGPEKLLDGNGPHDTAWCEWVDPADIDTDPGSFARHGVLDLIDAAGQCRQDLPGGGHLWIEPTRALVAIDVNSGRDTSFAAGLQTNLAAAQALPRLLRLQGLGGQVVLDPVPMPKKDRRTFETALKQAFRNDPEDTVLAGWTPLGHFELQRRRGRPPLSEVFR